MIEFDVNADNYWAMLSALSAKERVKVMRSAMRRSAAEMKHRAGALLISRLDNVRNPRAIKRAIWTQVYTHIAGFRISVAGDRYYYPARQRDLPLARWLEDGTGNRHTRSGGYTRGTLPAIRFLGDTQEEMKPAMTRALIENFQYETMKTAKKYGCI